MKRFSVAEVAKHFLNVWVFNYASPEEQIANNDECFKLKFFQDITTPYHSRKLDRFNCTIAPSSLP